MTEFVSRDLTADEIQVRKSYRGGDENSQNAELLLYADARAGMSILDDVCGPFGWSCQYKEVAGVTYCGIGIQDKVSGAFIWKWDAGSEQNFEKEKSVASSAFKRACARWLSGFRALYTAPKIVVPNEKYASYEVSDIQYADHKITHLTIVDNNGNVVFQMTPEFTRVQGGPFKYPEENKELPWSARLADWCGRMKADNEDPELHAKLLAFYYYVINQSNRGEKWGVKGLWKFFCDDLKAGKLEIDDSNPRHPKVNKLEGQ